MNTFNPDGEFELHMPIGSKLFPQYPIRSHTESYDQLSNTSGHLSSSGGNISISPDDCISTHFVIGIGTGNVLEARYTGLNTHAGDLLTVEFKYAKPAARGAISAQHTANLMHIVRQSDHLLEIQDTSVRVFD